MRALAGIALAALLTPLPAGGADLYLGSQVQVHYSDNVLSDAGGKNDDFSLRFAPYAKVAERNSNLGWELLYRPSFLGYLDTSAINGWEHEVQARVDWQIDERTVLNVSDSYYQLLSRGRFNEEILLQDGETVSEVDTGVRDYERNTLSANLLRRFDAVNSLRATLSHNLTNFDEGRDTRSISGSLAWIYQLSPRTVLSLGPRYTRQQVKATQTLQKAETDFYGITGSWRHAFDRGLTLSLSAGPSWIDSNQERDSATTALVTPFPLVRTDNGLFFVDAQSCDRDAGDLFFSAIACQPTGNLGLASTLFSPIPVDVEPGAPSVSQKRLTFFAAGSIEKRWRVWDARLSYTRQESPSSGLGTASITDTVSANVGWRPGQRWRASWQIGFSRRSQATEALQPLILVGTCGVDDGIPPFPLCPPASVVPDGAAFSRGVRLSTLDTNARVDQVSTRLSLSYQLRERVTLNGSLYYIDQSQSDDRFVSDLGLTRFTGFVGITWDLHPIPL